MLPPRGLSVSSFFQLLMVLTACSGDTATDSEPEETDDLQQEESEESESQHSDHTEDCTAEVCDGEDNDCDGTIDEDATNATAWYADADGDGFGDEEVSVTSCEAPSGMVGNDWDCDDEDSTAHQGADELVDGVDNDCDKFCDEDFIASGSLVITEVHRTPSVGRDGVFVEVLNTEDFDIHTCGTMQIMSDFIESVALSKGVFPAGAYTVIGVEDDTGLNGGLTPDILFNDNAFNLSEDDDYVALNLRYKEVDNVTWDGTWPAADGASIQLDPSHLSGASNDDAENWCLSTDTYGSGDLGTPGEANPTCDE